MEDRLNILNLFTLGVVAGIVYWIYKDVKSKTQITNKTSTVFGVRG